MKQLVLHFPLLGANRAIKSRRRPEHHCVAFAVVLGLGGCAAPETGMVPPPLLNKASVSQDGGSDDALGKLVDVERRTRFSETPQVPSATRSSTIKPGNPAPASDGHGDVTLAFDQQPLPAFVQLVFGKILKVNFSMDPALLGRSDLVTLRTGGPQTPAQVLETVRMLLKSYGVAVQEMGGFYRIVLDNNQNAYLPEIRRGRALPEVPLPLRPVFNLVEMSAVKASDVGKWLTAMFGTRITLQEDNSRNALLLSGQSADVTAALEAVQVLDQPLMRGRSSQLINPVVLSVDDLARRLSEVLGAEGYSVGVGQAPGLPISLLPISASNSLLVFAGDPAVLKHVADWVRKLDSLDNDKRRGGNYFTYEVQYADAQDLAKTLQELLASAPTQQQVVPAGAQVIGSPRQAPRIVVSKATNSLIVNTTNADDYAQLLSLMRALDKPSKSALIEVTVAEVNRKDSDQLGVEWNAGRGAVSGGTSDGLGIRSSGLNLSFLDSAGVLRAKINALASANKARVLSSPRVMARNGEQASIQVGEQVPIVTSQQSTAGTTVGGGTTATGVLQTIQYHDTGVILRVRPVIFAGRVELEVQQEVSSASSTTTGVNVSPTFSTRKVDTKLSIRDGATVVLGGLISSSQSDGNTGIPLLKDIPIAGQLFRTNTKDLNETELIILITPYVIDNDAVAEQVTEAMRNRLGAWTAAKAGVTPAAITVGGTVADRPLKNSTPAPVPESPSAPSASGGGDSPVEAPNVPSVSSAPSASVGAADAPSGLNKNSGQPIDSGMPPFGGGTAVSDPVLLEELRRAKTTTGVAKSAGTTAPPTTTKPTPSKQSPANSRTNAQATPKQSSKDNVSN